MVQASAVLVTAGISKDVAYTNGVAVYTMPKTGLMYEATVGGQKFKYLEESETIDQYLVTKKSKASAEYIRGYFFI